MTSVRDMRHSWLDESPYWADKIARQILTEQGLEKDEEVYLEEALLPQGVCMLAIFVRL